MPGTALTAPPATRAIAKTYSNPEEAYHALARAAKQAILLSPIVRIDHVPPFYEISIRLVQLNPDPNQGDFYTVPGGGNKLAPTKVALAKISAAAEVNWWPTIRQDDGSDPYYCTVTARGYYLAFTGQLRQISGEKEMDLREGSPAAVDMISKGHQKELSQARRHILAHAEAKARNRALREAFAVRSSFNPDDLWTTILDDNNKERRVPKPFVVPALVLTGRHEDPEMRRIFATEHAKRALEGVSRMFQADIRDPQSASAQHRAPPKLHQSAPPPADEDDDVEAAAEAAFGGDRRPPPDDDDRGADDSESPEPAGASTSAAPPPADDGNGATFAVKFGRCKGKALADFGNDDLQWYRDSFERELADEDKAKYHAKTQGQLNLLIGEMKRRGLLT